MEFWSQVNISRNTIKLKNTPNGYGLVARALHWGMALAILFMFGLGLWMRTLTYYSPWYNQAPAIHKSVGIILLVLLVLRFAWRLLNPAPDASYLKPVEQKLSHLMHMGFYALLIVLMLAGYFISTLGGRGISVFSFVEIPSIYVQKGLEDIFGFAHRALAYLLIAMVALHALVALKHHFINHAKTLLRMWHGDR